MTIRAAGGGKKKIVKKVKAEQMPTATMSELLEADLVDEKAKLVWNNLKSQLTDAQLLTDRQLPLLISYCNTYACKIRADKHVAEHGATIETSKGLKKNPAVTASADYANQMARLGSLLCVDLLTASKTGLKTEKEEPNEFDQF